MTQPKTKNLYTEPIGFRGTPGKWEPVAPTKYADLWAIKESSLKKDGQWGYADRIAEMQDYPQHQKANAQIMAEAKEAMKDLQAFIKISELLGGGYSRGLCNSY